MTINRTTKTESAARDILAFIRDGGQYRSRGHPVVSLSESGDLLVYYAVNGTADSETVLIDRLESDSLGDGWESATAGDVVAWLEANCEA